MTHAIGFIDEFRTHKIAGPDGNALFVLTPCKSSRPIRSGSSLRQRR
ncbi:hypothetical protein QP162_01705 [Sphingomonas aurantiaca]